MSEGKVKGLADPGLGKRIRVDNDNHDHNQGALVDHLRGGLTIPHASDLIFALLKIVFRVESLSSRKA